MTPVWLSVLAWAYISVCLGCAAIIAGDILIGRRRQPMGVMNFVFPITALYFGPLALWFYWRWARVPARAAAAMAPMPAMAGAPETGPAGHLSDNSKKRRSRQRPYGVMRASVRGLMAARLAARLSGRPYRAPMAAGAV
jgi:hypothetical protein